MGQPLPFTIQFDNGAEHRRRSARSASSASSTPTSTRALPPGRPPARRPPGPHPRTRRLVPGRLRLHPEQGLHPARQRRASTSHSNTITWLLQAIDPLTGEVIHDPTKGLLPPDNAAGAGRGLRQLHRRGRRPGLATGTADQRPGARAVQHHGPAGHAHDHLHRRRHGADHHPDGRTRRRRAARTTRCSGAARTTRPARASRRDGLRRRGRRRLQDLARPDHRHVRHLQRPGRPHLPVPGAGHRQRRQPRAAAACGTAVPSDDSQVNLGALPTVPRHHARTSARRPPPTAAVDQPAVHPGPAGHPLAHAAQPPVGVQDASWPPFTAQSFATGIGQSQPGIGPLALLACPTARSWPAAGRRATSSSTSAARAAQAGTPLATLTEPIYDMALDAAGDIWAATGGGPLLELDPTDRRRPRPVRRQPDPEPGHPAGHRPDLRLLRQRHRDLRPGHRDLQPLQRHPRRQPGLRPRRHALGRHLAAQPGPGHSVSPAPPLAPQLMFQFDADVDSIAFGQPGTKLAGLLFVSHTEEAMRPGPAPS